MRKINKKNIKFLSDQPLTADKEQEIRFGHQGIAQSLQKIIFNSPTPFTIGLFGKWGTGKTTILNLLQSKLEKISKISVVKFDIWKHETDSLRATFLKEIVNQLKKQKCLKGDFELSEKLDATITRTFEGRFKLNKTVRRILIYTCILAVELAFLINTYWPDYLSNYLSILFSGSIVSGFILFLLRQAFTAEKITSVTDRFKEPHEFEIEFQKIIEKMSLDRFLVIIDNLDRTTHKKAVELLTTIKTFLELDKCVFLIACDDEAIKKHLQGVYTMGKDTNKGQKPFDTDEFLRKFFNASLRIPEFIDTELQNYTEILLKETAIKELDSTDVAYVITNSFRENPRQIKQFINSLMAHFLLTQERESGEEPLIIPSGAITNNVAFLTKILIIRQKFPKECHEICESYLNMDEMKNIGSKEFKNFLRSTKLITTDDIRPFIFLKQSQEELLIPEIRDLELGLVDDNRDIVNEKLKSIKANPEQVNGLRRFLPSLIERNRNRRILLLNIISCSLDALRFHNLEMGRGYYDKVSDLLNDDIALKPELRRFPPAVIFGEVLTRCNTSDRNDIVAEYVRLLGEEHKDKKEPVLSTDYTHGLIQELLVHKDWLKNEKKTVKQYITEKYYSSTKILSLFQKKIDDQRDFVSEETISKFTSTFSDDDVASKNSLNEKFEILINFKAIITSNVAKDIIKSLQNLLTSENKKPYRTEKENLLDRIGDIFNNLHQQIIDIEDIVLLKPFSDIIVQGYNALGGWDQKKIFIFTCLKLVDMLNDPQKANINALIQNFFTNADIDSIKFVFDKFKKLSKEALIVKYVNVFQQRVLQQQQIFDLLYPITSKDTRTQWLETLIKHKPERAIVKLKEIDYKVANKSKVVAALLQIAPGIAFENKTALYEVVNEMKCANDAALRNNLFSQIKSLLHNTDKNQQQLGYSTLQGACTHISETSKREVARETVEWLRSLEPNTAGQSFTIKSVALNWNFLETPVKNDYIDFVFDKLIKRGVNVNNIRLGFEILFKIKPRYEDYSVYFDDVIVRVESESNDQIKAELKSGLLKLKPSKTNKKSKNYWEKLQ